MRKCTRTVLLLNARSGEVLVPSSGATRGWTFKDTNRLRCVFPELGAHGLVPDSYPRKLTRLAAGRKEAASEQAAPVLPLIQVHGQGMQGCFSQTLGQERETASPQPLKPF